MSEIVATVGLSALGLWVVIVATNGTLQGRGSGPRERALFSRWAACGGLVALVTAGWVTTGIATFLHGTEFWRGAWAGGSAVLWLGYAPALLWAVRVGQRRVTAARAADADLVA